jgi:hypothetical protein
MFTYRCPSCGKHHAVDKEFEQQFEAKCLRCGAAISVTPKLVHPSPSASGSSRSLPLREESITKSPGDSAIRAASQSNSVAEAESDEPALDAPSLPDDEPRKNGRAKSKAPSKDKDEKSGKKKPDTRVDKPPEKKDEKPAVYIAPEPQRWKPPAQSTPPAKGPRPRWQIIAGAVTVGLVLFVTIGYLVFGGKKPVPPRRAKTPTKAASKPTVAPPKIEKKAEPPIKTPDMPQIVVSAPRLSAELAADADLANIKYGGKFLEISGLFATIEQKDGLRPPAHAHAVFAVSGVPISCDLQDSSPLAPAWQRLKPNQPFTMRGRYEKNGYLRGCFLMPEYTSTADSRYKGRLIEVSGRVRKANASGDSETFPSVIFEGETNSVMEIHCLFRTTDAAEVRQIQPGSQLTIQGKCSGRETGGRDGRVRLDNCQLVYTSAPPQGTPRLDAPRLLREYEEDVHPDYLPPPGEEQQFDTVWTIRQLVKEHTANPKAFLKKCGNRILRVRGKPQNRGKPQQGGTASESVVVLTSGDTDLPFQVECHFAAEVWEDVRQRHEPEYRIRGLFTGKIAGDKLRLDNCRFETARVTREVLTANYLPHTPGRSFMIDVAAFGTLFNGKLRDVVQREVHVQGKDELTAIMVTHIGSLTGKSLFENEVQQQWVQQNKVRIRTPETTGIYFRRLHAGFVELGTPHPGQDGKTAIAWVPKLKLNTLAGEKWKWQPPEGPHEYVVEKFDEFRGQRSVVIREIFTPARDVLHPIETLHVYVKGLGEVELRQWRQLDLRGGKKLLSEMKWVDNAKSAPNGKPGDKPAVKTPLVPPAPINDKAVAPKAK